MPAFEDVDGNRMWLDRDRKVILQLKKQPKSGKRQRILGRVSRGILKIDRIGAWEMRKYGCWYVNRYLMMHHAKFEFNFVQFSGKTSTGTVSGFFYPEIVLDEKFIHYSGYEAQNKLEFKHIAKTPELAKQQWEAAKAMRDAPSNLGPSKIKTNTEIRNEQNPQNPLFPD